MADGLCCIVCTEAFFSPHIPMVLPCGHTVCKVCIDHMIKVNHVVQCPTCRDCIGSMKVINELKENYQIKDTLSGLEMNCAKHSKAALWVCATECEPLCDLCHRDHSACDKRHILEQRGDLEFDLVAMVRDLLKRVQVNQDLASKAARVANAPLKERVSVCQQLLKIERGDGEDPRMRFITQAKADFPLIDSFLLTNELLALIYYTPDSLEECQRLAACIRALVNVRVADDRNVPEYMYCLRCWATFHKNQKMRVLPCYSVRHLVCEACAQMMVMEGVVSCGLDSRVFSITDLTKLFEFQLQPCVDDGNALGQFVPMDQFMFHVTLFRHLQPHVSLPREQRIKNFRGYNYDPSSTQVEAITFRCFANVSIGGIGLSNPVEAGTTLTIEYVKCYAGTKAVGSPTVATTTTPQTLSGGGNSTNTNVQLGTPFTVSACSVYTIKIQFRRKPGETEPVLMYRGNHLTRPATESNIITGTGWDTGIDWEFDRTEGVERSESCLGQHYLTGPILRLIYRINA